MNHDEPPTGGSQPTVEPPTTAAANTAFSADPPIQAGIIHLMIWTAGSAVLLGLSQLYLSGEMSPAFRTLITVGHTLHSFVYGAALGSLIYWVYRMVNGWKFPLSAGHWVLMAFGVMACMGGVRMVLYSAITTQFDSFSDNMFQQRILFGTNALMSLASMIMMACFTALKIPVRWKVYALMFAFALALEGMSMVVMSFHLFEVADLISLASTTFDTFLLVPLIVCLVLDLRDNVRYDALHWAGLVVAVASVLMGLYWQIGSRVASLWIEVAQ